MKLGVADATMVAVTGAHDVDVVFQRHGSSWRLVKNRHGVRGGIFSTSERDRVIENLKRDHPGVKVLLLE